MLDEIGAFFGSQTNNFLLENILSVPIEPNTARMLASQYDLPNSQRSREGQSQQSGNSTTIASIGAEEMKNETEPNAINVE